MEQLRHKISISAKSKEIAVGIASGLSLLFGVVALAPSVWAPAWQPGGLGYIIVQALIAPVGILNHTLVYFAALGLFTSTSALWLADTLKKYQGLLLWINIVVGFGLLISNWQLRIPSSFVAHSFSFLLGGILGLQIGGIPVIRYLVNQYKIVATDPPYLFKNAIRTTVALTLLFLIIGLADFHLPTFGRNVAGPRRTSLLIEHLSASVAIAAPMLFFSRYRSGTRIIQLGPPRSGKTSVAGGLYADIDIKPDEEPIGIYRDHISEGKFPPVTKKEQGPDGCDVIQFSYITDGYVLRKRQTITTIDYSGEWLTGLKEVGEGTEPIHHYIEQGVEGRAWYKHWMASWFDPRRWRNAVEAIRDGEDLGEEALVQELATLIRTADTIVFTIPTEDFMQNLVTERPDNLREYTIGSTYRIFDETTTDGTEELKRQNLASKDIVSLDKEPTSSDIRETKYLPPEGEGVGLPPKKSGWIETDDGWYAVAERARESPTEYVEEYDSILDELYDKRKYNFVWVMTMADLAKEDCKAHYNDIDHRDVSPSVQQELDGPFSPLSNERHYRLFSHWLKEQFLDTDGIKIHDLLGRTNESYVYPVWFQLCNEDGRDFETEGGNTLKGSKYLLRRYAGQRLDVEYPDASDTVYDLFDAFREVSRPKDTVSRELYEETSDRLDE